MSPRLSSIRSSCWLTAKQVMGFLVEVCLCLGGLVCLILFILSMIGDMPHVCQPRWYQVYGSTNTTNTTSGQVMYNSVSFYQGNPSVMVCQIDHVGPDQSYLDHPATPYYTGQSLELYDCGHQQCHFQDTGAQVSRCNAVFVLVAIILVLAGLATCGMGIMMLYMRYQNYQKARRVRQDPLNFYSDLI